MRVLLSGIQATPQNSAKGISSLVAHIGLNYADRTIGLKTRWPIVQIPPSVLHGGFSEIELKFS